MCVGVTAHSRFGIPVRELNDDTYGHIGKHTKAAQALREAHVIVWDEAAAAHRDAIACASRTVSVSHHEL